MNTLVTVLVVVAAVVLAGVLLSVRIVWQYEQGVHFRLGKLRGARQPGLRLIIPLIDQLRRVSLRIVTMPIQSQGPRPTPSISTSARFSTRRPPTGASRSHSWN